MTLSFGTCGASLMQPIMAVSERLEARWVSSSPQSVDASAISKIASEHPCSTVIEAV